MNLDLGSLFFRLGIDQSGFRTGLDKAEQDLGTSGNKLASIAANIAGKLGIALTLGAAIKFGKDSIREFQEAERASADLRQVLNQLGDGAIYTGGEIRRMADGMAELSRFEDDAVLGAEAILLRYREIGRNIFPQVLSLTIDLAEKMGGGEGSLRSAATLLGRAMEDPETATRSLRAADVVLDDSQKDLIKSMMKANDVAGAQKIILDMLEGAIGGRARDLGDLEKATSELSKSWKELLEAMGKSLAPDVKQGAGFWTTQFKGLKEYIELSRFAAEEFSKAGMGKFGYLPIYTKLGYIDEGTRTRYAASKEKELAIENQLGKEQANRAGWYKYFTEQTEKRLGVEKSSLEYSKTKLSMERETTREIENQFKGWAKGKGWQPSFEPTTFKTDANKAWQQTYGPGAEAEFRRWWENYGKAAEEANDRAVKVINKSRTAVQSFMNIDTKDYQEVPKLIIASAETMQRLEIEAYKAADVAAYFGGAFVDAAFAGKNALNVLLNALRSFVSQAITEWIRLKVLGMSDWFKMGGGSSGAILASAGSNLHLGGGLSESRASLYSGAGLSKGGYANRATLNLSIIDKREASAPPISVERGTGADGSDVIQLIVESTVKNAFNSGKFDSSMRRNYRLSRVGKAA